MSEDIRYVPVRRYKGSNYFASSDGKIYRIREVKPSIGKKGKGYKILAMFSKDGVKKYHTVHSIIAECFIGPRPPGLDINHKDGNKWHNDESNLEYMTASENTKHAFRLGLRVCGEKEKDRLRRLGFGHKAPNRKLSDADAIKLLEMYQAGNKSMIAVGKEFGVSVRSVHGIVHGQLYKQKT